MKIRKFLRQHLTIINQETFCTFELVNMGPIFALIKLKRYWKGHIPLPLIQVTYYKCIM